PSSETQALDDIGLSATKTFSYAILPEKAVTESPAVEFSYFDPNAERYVVLKSEAIKVEVQGDAHPRDALPAPVLTPPEEARPAQKPELDVLDILPQPSEQVSFIPLIAQPAFWIAQAFPLSALVFAGLALWVQQARTASLPVRKWLQQKRLLWHKINASQSRPEVLDAAVRLLELQLLIRSRGDKVRSLDEALHAVPEDLRTALNALIETRGLSAYGGMGSEKLSDEERHQIRQSLRQWEVNT
ncbi:MAG: BatD family protein, partial [Verrucomicrobia bacterium]|nr:BatD family protein [Verrucomicrobiota bacterium]